jgi:hypothetical protein
MARKAVQLAPSEAVGAEILALPHRSSGIAAATAALDALNAPSEPAPHDEQTLREGALAVADLERRHELRALQLTDDECDELWVAIRREPRMLTLREQDFLAHFKNSAESWATNFETTPEFAALKMRLAWLEGKSQCG